MAAGGALGRSILGIERSKKTSQPLAGGSYQTADDRWLLLAFVEGDKNWPVFTKAIGRDDLAADGLFSNAKNRSANAEVLVAELDRTFRSQPLDFWKEVLDAARLPYGVVQVPAEIVKDPQLLANDVIVPIADGSAEPRYTVNSPITVREAPKVAPRVAPELGEHSNQILEELGFTLQEVESLRANGAIQGAAAHAAAK